MRRLSWYLRATSWNRPGLSRHVMGLLYLHTETRQGSAQKAHTYRQYNIVPNVGMSHVKQHHPTVGFTLSRGHQVIPVIQPRRVLSPFHQFLDVRPTENIVKYRTRLQLKPDGTRWRTRGEVKGETRMEWVASTLHTTSEHGVSSIITADAHTLAASSRLNWRPRRFKWTRSFRRKTKSGFCASAITFQLASTRCVSPPQFSGGRGNTHVMSRKQVSRWHNAIRKCRAVLQDKQWPNRPRISATNYTLGVVRMPLWERQKVQRCIPLLLI